MTKTIAIIGGGPAGLMAAEMISNKLPKCEITIYDAMPSLGRKFLMAGKSGLNISHNEEMELFLQRFGKAADKLAPALKNFTAEDIREWAGELGIVTFVGTSGRVFPTGYKAAPLLRSWLRRLRAHGVMTKTRHKWRGWGEGNGLLFSTENGQIEIKADATILALGGASWPKLGSDGSWVPYLQNKGITLSPLRPANCGFNVDWSDFFRNKFEGEPVKSCQLSFAHHKLTGDFVITKYGIESGPIYNLSANLRDKIDAEGNAVLMLDLLPHKDASDLTQLLARPKGSQSMATHIKKVTGLIGVKAGLLRECLSKETFNNPALLAQGIKCLPVTLTSPRPMAEAISTAGGIDLDELNDGFMLKRQPGIFCVGEMLDWEAPTGGYLLTACMAQGRSAGIAASQWVIDK